MSWNGSVRILVAQTRPVCTSLMKNRWTVRNSRPPRPTTSQISATWRTNSIAVGVRLEDAEQRRIEVEQQRRQRPDRHQHDLAPQIVADLDLFLVLVRGLVDLVVVLGLEEEVADLPAGHRHQPADQRRHRRIGEHQHVGAQEADRAHQVQRLIDPAVVVVAMIVPALHSQSLRESRPSCRSSVSGSVAGMRDSMKRDVTDCQKRAVAAVMSRIARRHAVGRERSTVALA